MLIMVRAGPVIRRVVLLLGERLAGIVHEIAIREAEKCAEKKRMRIVSVSSTQPFVSRRGVMDSITDSPSPLLAVLLCLTSDRRAKCGRDLSPNKSQLFGCAVRRSRNPPFSYFLLADATQIMVVDYDLERLLKANALALHLKMLRKEQVAKDLTAASISEEVFRHRLEESLDRRQRHPGRQQEKCLERIYLSGVLAEQFHGRGDVLVADRIFS